MIDPAPYCADCGAGPLGQFYYHEDPHRRRTCEACDRSGDVVHLVCSHCGSTLRYDRELDTGVCLDCTVATLKQFSEEGR